jgi:serine/threonine protein kinase
MPLAPGTQLGPYEILSPLGKGGMGEVYRAKDTRLNRDVAIKVLPDLLSSDATALARFEREAKVLAALSHPNILTIFDVGQDNGVSFVVMKLLPGETLRTRIAQRRPRWPDAVQMGIEIAEGLSTAHSKGIMNRDLKPENIFLTRDEHIKILDFGLARWDHDPNTAYSRDRIRDDGRTGDRNGRCYGDHALYVSRTAAGCARRRKKRHLFVWLRPARSYYRTAPLLAADSGGNNIRYLERRASGADGV